MSAPKRLSDEGGGSLALRAGPGHSPRSAWLGSRPTRAPQDSQETQVQVASEARREPEPGGGAEISRLYTRVATHTWIIQ